jgi:serine/threonine protein kinase
MIPVASARGRDLHPGDLVDGRYRILGKLADGGMGTVYLTEHMLIRRRLALKLLHAELATDGWMMHRFLNEAAAAGTLDHPHIIESTDMGFTRDGVPYIVFEYLEGCLLLEEIRRLGRLPVRRALVIARQVASALEAAHAAQIAHLDLKSDNVVLTHRGNVFDHAKLIDFGISRFMTVDFEPPPPGILMGTPEFMAPEQITNPRTADARADIYALGVLLYEMLTGRCPFESKDLRWVVHQAVHAAPPPLDPPVSPALDHLLFDGLLVKSPDQRLQTMAEIGNRLEALIAAQQSGVPRALDTFEESQAIGLASIWSVDGLFRGAAARVDGALEVPGAARDFDCAS